MTRTAQRVTFTGSLGTPLAGRLDLPAGPPRAFALFAPCFTCSKDVVAAGRIAAELNGHGIGVLRFDFHRPRVERRRLRQHELLPQP